MEDQKSLPPQQTALETNGSLPHRSQVCLGSLWATSCTAGSLLQDNTQWFICPARSSRALIRTHRVILMLSLSESGSTTPLEFSTSQHWLPRHCIVWCRRTDWELCLTPTRRWCRVTWINPEVKTALAFSFAPPQHSCQVRRLNPANLWRTCMMLLIFRALQASIFQALYPSSVASSINIRLTPALLLPPPGINFSYTITITSQSKVFPSSITKFN